MGKIHDQLEEKLSEVKKSIIDGLNDLIKEKAILPFTLELCDSYTLRELEDDDIYKVNCVLGKAITRDGDSFDFIELEIDILLWLVFMIEENEFVI